MELNTIAILGPRGNVGTALTTALLKNHPNRFTITGISRTGSAYAPPPNSNITAKTVDYSSFDALKEAFVGQDAIINVVTGGATQWEPTKLIIDAAVAAGVKLYFANEYVGNVEREQYKRLPEAFVGAKVRTRAYLQELAKEGKLHWTGLTTGPFFDMWLMLGPGGFNIPNRSARIYGTGANPLPWTPVPTVAVALCNMLLHPDRVLDRSITICPIPGLTQNALLATLESMLDTKFTITKVDVALMNKNARILLERGEAGKAMKGLNFSNQFYEGDCGHADVMHQAENALVGVKEMSIEDAVKMAIETYGLNKPVVDGMHIVDPPEI